MFTSPSNDWHDRLKTVVDTMREMSLQTDPQAMVRTYGQRMQQLLPAARRISLSRRGLDHPQFRITRYSGWAEEINPWKQPERLPLLAGGILGEMIYGDTPRVLNDIHIAGDDPAAEYLAGTRSLMAIPLFDQGHSKNMVVVAHDKPHGFNEQDLPERVWMSNLFGRAAQNLVLAEQLDVAYQAVERDLKIVADIQRSLLPKQLPQMSTMRMAAHYETSRHAGGDYYDFFQLPHDRWGVLIADVSGHGTPAAVVMAVLHSLAHMYPGDPTTPSLLLNHLNHHLTTRYTAESGHFVTAFYGIYDERSRTLTFSSAGHNPPRLRSCGSRNVTALDHANSMPLGFMPGIEYRDHTITLRSGDRLVFDTDGITEAASAGGELYGTERLDRVLADCRADAQESLDRVIEAVRDFTGGLPPSDDRTLLIGDVI